MPSLKPSWNMLTSIDVKFISDRACLKASLVDKGLFRSANILQIGDAVHHRVVFLLFLLCFQLIVRLLTTSEMFRHFVVTTKTTQPLPQVFYNPRHKSWNTCVIFPSPMLIWVCSHFSAPKYARLNIGEGERHIWVRTKVWSVNVKGKKRSGFL